jgi:uncharacterized protein
VQWNRNPDIVEVGLDTDHSVLFNPQGDGGVAAVNQPARQILDYFQDPSTFDEALAWWSGPPDNFRNAFNRLAQLAIIKPAGRASSQHFQASQVLTAWLHMTNACNLSCSYCYINKSNERMDEATGRAAVRAVIKSAVKHNYPGVKFKYAGGEATLNHRLVLKLHDYADELASQKGLKLHGVILSNGVAFPAKLAEALKARKMRVMISLDGLGHYHDSQRPFVNGQPSFHLVERTITRLSAAGLLPHLSITVTDRNLNGLPEAVRFALERELTFSLNFVRSTKCATNVRDIRHKEQATINAFLETFAVIEEHLPPWTVLGSVLDRGQLLQPRQRPCGVGQDYVVINHRGQVAKCHMEIEKTLGEVLNSDPLLLVQQNTNGVQNPPVDEKKGCSPCPWRNWCSGGCPVNTYNAIGRFDLKSPNCSIYKAIYPEALKLEGLRLLKYCREKV